MLSWAWVVWGRVAARVVAVVRRGRRKWVGGGMAAPGLIRTAGCLHDASVVPKFQWMLIVFPE